MYSLDKAELCAHLMKDYFSYREDDANVCVPEDIRLGSLEHIIYLFYSCLLDYGMRSKIYHANLLNTYRIYKQIFNPSYVIEEYKDNEEELFTIIKENIHPRYPKVALKKWLSLSLYLSSYPNDSLLLYIKNISSYKELYNFITSINGYGQKTGGLLLRLISEAGICEIDEDLEDIPIDRHDVEISYLNGVIDKDKLNNNELKELGSIWIKAARKCNIKASDIDRYLWTIGNSMCVRRKCLDCPLSLNCHKKV